MLFLNSITLYAPFQVLWVGIVVIGSCTNKCGHQWSQETTSEFFDLINFDNMIDFCINKKVI